LFNLDGELEVTERGAGANMSIDIADGAAIVDGEWARSTSTVNLTVAANASGLTRYDLVFAHWTAAAQQTNLRIVDGVPGAGSCESIANYQNAGVEWGIPLACVEVVNGAVNIQNADITDLREFCRFRTDPNDLVDGSTLDISTSNLIQIANNGVGINQIAAAIAGNGLVGGGGAALDVNPDGVTLEINADAIRIAAGAAGNGLGGGGGAALSVNVDAATITIVADTLQVGTIDNSHILNRTRYEYLGAGSLHETAANPPAWGAIGAQPVPSEGWVLPTGVDRYAVGHWRVPADLVAGAVTVTIVWSHVAAANQVCRWLMNFVTNKACGDDLTGGTTTITQDVNANLADANLRMCTALTTTINMSADEYLDFYLGRNGAHGNDTLAVSAVLLGVQFAYTADM
jgi:hypothetical protein